MQPSRFFSNQPKPEILLKSYNNTEIKNISGSNYVDLEKKKKTQKISSMQL